MATAPSSRSLRRRALLLGSLWLGLLLLGALFRAALLPLAGAALVAYLVAPLVRRLERMQVSGRTLPRWLAILLIYAAFFGVVYLFVVAIVPQLYRELTRISGNAVAYAQSLTPERIQEMAQDTEQWFAQRGIPVALSERALEGTEAEADATARPSWSVQVDLERMIRSAAARFSGVVRDNVGNLVEVTRSVVTGVFTGVFTFFLMLFLAAYLSIDALRVRRYAWTLVPPEWAPDVLGLVERIDRSLAGVVRGQVTICLVNGALTLIGLVLFGVKFAFLLATVATLFSLIPIFGTILSSVPIVAVGLSQSWRTGLAMLLWIIGIHALEAYFLNPKIMGSAARIHPIVVVLALVAGERTYGLLGALIAVPAAAVLVAGFDFVRQRAQPAGSPPA
ncbi:MAG TPA: AI-2E family transporter [Myxococcaceae bacterium]|jgi:predicted PurR-regulated permease PerM|nr:AI-2E family transporter [Myxococcaceae bacterium]